MHLLTELNTQMCELTAVCKISVSFLQNNVFLFQI